MKIKAFILTIMMIWAQYPLFSNGLKIDSLYSETDTITDDIISDQIYEEEMHDDDNCRPEKIQDGDTTFITLGKKRIKIYEEDGETSVKIEEKDKNEERRHEFERDYRPWKHFKGHWAGLSAGPNNYVNSNFSLNRSEEDEFMEVDPIKSWNFNIDFAQYSIGLGSDKVGLTTGLGIEWNNYHFNDTNIIVKFNGIIEAKPVPEGTKKKRLQTTYLTIPLLFEVQFPNRVRENRVYLSAGVIAGIKLFSNTKIKYIKDGNKQKEKFKSDYYLNSIRYGVTARAGYKDCGIYFTYYLTPLFIEDHGPELYPLAAGIVCNF